MPGVPKWSDKALLTILDLWENERLSAKTIGERFGVSRSAILGLVYRIDRETEALGWKDAAVKPENRDGNMPHGWWKAGLAMRDARKGRAA